MSEDQAPYIVEVPAVKTGPATPLEQALELLLMAWRLLEIDCPNDERVDALHDFLLKHLPGDDAITPENLERVGWKAGHRQELKYPLHSLYLPAWVKTVYSQDEDDMPSYLDVFVREDGTVYLRSSDGIDEVISPLPIRATTMTQLIQLYTALGGTT